MSGNFDVRLARGCLRDLTPSDPRHLSSGDRLTSSQILRQERPGALGVPRPLASPGLHARGVPRLPHRSPPACRVPPCQEEQLACARGPAGRRDRCTAASSMSQGNRAVPPLIPPNSSLSAGPVRRRSACDLCCRANGPSSRVAGCARSGLVSLGLRPTIDAEVVRGVRHAKGPFLFRCRRGYGLLRRPLTGQCCKHGDNPDSLPRRQRRRGQLAGGGPQRQDLLMVVIAERRRVRHDCEVQVRTRRTFVPIRGEPVDQGEGLHAQPDRARRGHDNRPPEGR